ncbi:hypothetical protein EYC84_009105 [Monilinia fructicola]|uniref:Uncharacterized protein n=1 Tax=Monilinia fructicola TaxID=38448 RepID=A0A5M9JFR4_MONFR|nr:hypothetical protein EYC84_009105 [Monilinia fructicola]
MTKRNPDRKKIYDSVDLNSIIAKPKENRSTVDDGWVQILLIPRLYQQKDRDSPSQRFGSLAGLDASALGPRAPSTLAHQNCFSPNPIMTSDPAKD